MQLYTRTDLCMASCWSMGVTRVTPVHGLSERLLKALSSGFSGLGCTRGVLRTSLDAASLLSASGFCTKHRARLFREHDLKTMLCMCMQLHAASYSRALVRTEENFHEQTCIPEAGP